MNPHLKFRCLLTVEAEADPQVPARILDLFTVRNQLPDWFSVRKHGTDAIRVTIELCGAEDEETELLARKILKIPTVLDVTRTWLGQRDQIAA
jgi:hypothetical protein